MLLNEGCYMQHRCRNCGGSGGTCPHNDNVAIAGGQSPNKLHLITIIVGEKILTTDVFNNILAMQGVKTILDPCKSQFR